MGSSTQNKSTQLCGSQGCVLLIVENKERLPNRAWEPQNPFKRALKTTKLLWARHHCIRKVKHFKTFWENFLLKFWELPKKYYLCNEHRTCPILDWGVPGWKRVICSGNSFFVPLRQDFQAHKFLAFTVDIAVDHGVWWIEVFGIKDVAGYGISD